MCSGRSVHHIKLVHSVAKAIEAIRRVVSVMAYVPLVRLRAD